MTGFYYQHFTTSPRSLHPYFKINIGTKEKNPLGFVCEGNFSAQKQ